MSQIEAISFGCGGTLVDGKATYSHAYTAMFREFGIHVGLEEISTRFKGAKPYEIIDIISREQDVTMVQVDAKHIYRAEVARLFDTELEDIVGANELLANIGVPMCIASNGSVSKVQRSLGKLNMLHYLPEKLLSGYGIQRWKPGPALMFHTAKAMNASAENCIPADGSSTGAQSGIDAGTGVFYSRADPHSKPIVHLKVTTFICLSQLPELWKVRGWDITVQLLTLSSPTPLKLARKDK